MKLDVPVTGREPEDNLFLVKTMWRDRNRDYVRALRIIITAEQRTAVYDGLTIISVYDVLNVVMKDYL